MRQERVARMLQIFEQDGQFMRIGFYAALTVFLGIVAFFLLTEHTAHVFGALPYLLLLACPLLHLFMHRHRHHHRDHHESHEHEAGHAEAPSNPPRGE